MALAKRQTNDLLELLAIPTAPFRESLIRQFCSERLTEWGVPHCEDRHGNLLVGVDSLVAYRRLLKRRTDEPLRLFIAHMDHPGFHGQRWVSRGVLKVQWHGGSPVKHLNGARMWLADGAGYVGFGKLRKVRRHPQGYGMTEAEVLLEKASLAVADRPAKELYGAFAFRKPVWTSGKRIYTKAADDLVGVFAIMETARQLRKGIQQGVPFVGLLTRAEEVGFVGMVAHLESESLSQARRQVLAVSLEASRTLPGAVIGKGPVVRLGDRRTTFDPAASQLLTVTAEKVLKGRYQRRIMDGGSCEATAATVFGVTTIGMTVPLGNYHNQGYEGGADCPNPEGPAPEFVHQDDVEGMVKLCQGLMRTRLNWEDPWRDVRLRLQRNRKQYRRLLAP